MVGVDFQDLAQIKQILALSVERARVAVRIGALSPGETDR